jgi:hypothetical protein
MSKASKNLILVEGKNEEHVFGHLFHHYGIEKGIIGFKNKEGISNLLESLPVELRGSELERLGIVVDADTNLEGRWDSLRNVLIKSGYSSTPKTPSPDGIIIQQDEKPVVGIWLMPNNHLPGMLEDFVSFLVPDGNTLWARASDCLNGIPEEHRCFSPNHKIKAHIHTWLAWQEEPGTPLGSAIIKRYFDANAEHAKKLIDWVRELFNLT